MNNTQVLTRAKLGELALDAAISVEYAQRNPSASTADLDEFMSALSNQFKDADKGSLRDETMFPYYSFALARSSDNQEPTRNQFPELIARMLAKREVQTEARDELEQIKQFCLAFHEAMVKAVLSGRPSRSQYDGRVR